MRLSKNRTKVIFLLSLMISSICGQVAFWSINNDRYDEENDNYLNPKQSGPWIYLYNYPPDEINVMAGVTYQYEFSAKNAGDSNFAEGGIVVSFPDNPPDYINIPSDCRSSFDSWSVIDINNPPNPQIWHKNNFQMDPDDSMAEGDMIPWGAGVSKTLKVQFRFNTAGTYTLLTRVTMTEDYSSWSSLPSSGDQDDQQGWDCWETTINVVPFTTLEVTDPTSSTVWIQGTSETVHWTSDGLGNGYVEIHVIKDSVVQSTISSNTANDGSYTWTVDNSLAYDTDYQVRIRSKHEAAIQDWSDYFQIGNQAPSKSITVTNPTSSSDWPKGQSRTITWTSSGSISNVKIELYKGINYQSTITSSTSNDGSYSWNIPTSLTDETNYKLKIIDTSTPSIFDYSEYFEISTQSSSSKSITVTNPISSSSWSKGSAKTITWTSTGSISNVKIELYKGTSLSSTIASSTSNDGSHSWNVLTSLTDATNYRMKITDTSETSIYDYSDYFQIKSESNVNVYEEYRRSNEILLKSEEFKYQNENYNVGLYQDQQTGEIGYLILDNEENIITEQGLAYDILFMYYIREIHSDWTESKVQEYRELFSNSYVDLLEDYVYIATYCIFVPLLADFLKIFIDLTAAKKNPNVVDILIPISSMTEFYNSISKFMFERTSDSAFESIMDVCFQAVELYDDYDTMLTAVRTTNQNLKLMKRAELWGTSLNMGPIIKETRQSWIDAGSILASIFLGDTDDVLLDVCVSSMTMIRIMMELIGRYGEILLNYQNDDTAIEMTQILYYYQTLMTYWTIKAQYCKCQEIALRELSDDAVVLIMPQNWLDKDNINKWDSLAQDCFDLTLTYEDKMNSILQQVDNGYYDFLDRTDQTNNLDNIGFWKAVSPSNSLSSSISQSGTKEDFNLKLSETKEVVTWTQNETNVVEFQTYSKDNSKLFVAAYSVYLSSSLKLILDSKNINSKDGIFFKEENEVYSLSYNDKAVLQFLGAKEEKVEDAMESIVRFEADTNFEIDGFPLELLLLGTLLGIISISYIYLRKYKFLN